MKGQKIIQYVKKRRSSLIDMGVLLFLIMFSALWDNDAFGLYLDSVNPDYLAVQLLHPNEINPIILLPHIGVPLLGQLYHGTVTMFMQYIALLFVGEASLTLLRVLNGLYAFCACVAIYFILEKLNVKRYIIMLSEICLVTSISFFTIMKVQFYIKLPGTALTLLAILLLLYGKQREKEYQYILMAGIFSGLAFYSYFIYLFFFPMFLVSVYVLFKKESAKYNLFSYIGGYAIGATGYFIGYFGLIVKILVASKTELLEEQMFRENSLLIVFCCWFVALAVIYFINTWKKLWFTGTFGKISSIIFIVWGLIGCVLLGVMLVCNHDFIIHWFEVALKNLNVKGKEAGFLSRLSLLGTYLFSIFGNSVENKVFGTSVTKFSKFYLVLYLASIVIIVLACKKDSARHKYGTFIKFNIGFILSFFLCAFFFISRMGIQHFVPIYISSFLTVSVAVSAVYEIAIERSQVGKRLFAVGVSAVGILCISINILNGILMHRQLSSIGCKGTYTSNINEVAYEAKENKQKGERELYIFPEWGMLSGFEYLTNNQVYCITDYNNADKIKWYYENGYTLKVCYFDEENENDYRKIFTVTGVECELEEKLDNEGEAQLYVLSAQGRKKDIYLNYGFYEDGWMSEEASFEFGKQGDVIFEYYVPAEMEGATLTIMDSERNFIVEEILIEGIKETVIDTNKKNRGEFIVKVSKYINPLRDGTGEDRRNLSILMREIKVK